MTYPKKVIISQAQIDLAEKLGISKEEYAIQVVAGLRKARRIFYLKLFIAVVAAAAGGFITYIYRII